LLWVTWPPNTEAFHFHGKERDAETGWDYFGKGTSRVRKGSFTSPDPSAEC